MNENKNVYYWLRMINNLSSEQVSEQLQISLSYVRAIETGKKQPSKRLLRVYANLFDIDEEIIVEFSKKEMTSTKKFLLMLLQKYVKYE